MIVINDFFKRKKEAVSNQMELVKDIYGCKIISATRFMKQKALKKEDRKDNIYIFHPLIYHIVLILIMFRKDKDVHIFEEEPQFEKRFLFNLFKKNVYVSMYREPFPKYINHLKKYKNLKSVYVEMDEHKDLLVNAGIDKNIVHVTYTPAKIERKRSNKVYNPKHINLLYASWNNKEGNPLYERGLVYLLELLKKNKNLYLNVLLRDNDTEEYVKMIEKDKLSNRIKLLDVKEEELEEQFDNCDFVVYPIQKKLTKDVPNSLIDGLNRAKPIILSTIFGFAKVVEKFNAGIIIEPNTKPFDFDISSEEYLKLSNNAFNLSKKYNGKEYQNTIIKNYRKVKQDESSSN